MKIILRFAFIAVDAELCSANCITPPQTEIDNLTFYDEHEKIPAYMREHSLNGDEMISVLDGNIRWLLEMAAKGDGNRSSRESAALKSVSAIAHTGSAKRLEAIAGYAGENIQSVSVPM